MRASIPIVLGLLIVGAIFLVSEGHEPYSARPGLDGESGEVEDLEPMLEGREVPETRSDPRPSRTPPEEPDIDAAEAREQKISKLIEKLKSKDQAVRESAYENPEDYNAEDMRVLIEAMAAEWKHGVHPMWTFNAQFLFWKVGEPAVVPLAETVGHDHAYFWASTSLKYMAGLEDGDISSALPTLIDHLREGTPNAQAWAADVIVHTGPRRSEAVRDLTTVLESDVTQTRIQAASALGEMGSAASIALGAIERRLQVLGDAGGVEGDTFREAYRKILGE